MLVSRVPTRVVRGDINFGILRDPLNFLFLIDLYGPYLIEFLIENGSFLLTKAHELNCTVTNFEGSLKNVSRIEGHVLKIPKMM